MKQILFLILYGSFIFGAQSQQQAISSQNNLANNQTLDMGGAVAAVVATPINNNAALAAMSVETVRAVFAQYDKPVRAPLRVATTFAAAAQMTDQDESGKDGYASSEDSEEGDATYLNKEFDLDLPTPKGYRARKINGKKVFERFHENPIINDPDFRRLVMDEIE
jgi:hypothetical protein